MYGYQVSSYTPPEPDDKTCTCDLQTVLMVCGCVCGAITRWEERSAPVEDTTSAYCNSGDFG